MILRKKKAGKREKGESKIWIGIYFPKDEALNKM